MTQCWMCVMGTNQKLLWSNRGEHHCGGLQSSSIVLQCTDTDREREKRGERIDK